MEPDSFLGAATQVDFVKSPRWPELQAREEEEKKKKKMESRV